MTKGTVQTIRTDRLKPGYRLSVDIHVTRGDGSRVLLFPRGQDVGNPEQRQRLSIAGIHSVSIDPDSIRITLDGIEGHPRHLEQIARQRAEVDALRQSDRNSQERQSSLHQQAMSSLEIDITGIDQDFESNLELARQKPDLSDIMALLREDCSVLQRHSIDVATRLLRVLVMYEPDAPDETLHQVYLGGLLHDIGLTHCTNAENLDTQELFEDCDDYRQHSIFGEQLLQSVPSLPGLVRRMVLEHHENLSGNGYPQGLSGTEIHPYSLLLGLCEKHDHLIQASGYRAGLSPIVALNLMQGWADTEFPARQISAFKEACGPYPMGAPVQLANGLSGRVVKRQEEPAHPLVAVRSENGLRLMDTTHKGANIQKGLSPQSIDLHPAELF